MALGLRKCPQMSAIARQALVPPASESRTGGGNGHLTPPKNADAGRSVAVAPDREAARVVVSAENRLLRDALARMLTRRGDIDVTTVSSAEPLAAAHADIVPDVVVLSSLGNLADDVEAIRKVRNDSPGAKILLIGGSGDEFEFLQCVRSGISGYLVKEACSEDVLKGVRAVLAGEAMCSGMLCAALFRLFEREAATVPSAMLQQKLGLTRREQQLLPLLAQGLTNKEIANQFCLSEQTVKNHLYRMKHKIGAEDRLGIVQLCRTHGMAL